MQSVFLILYSIFCIVFKTKTNYKMRSKSKLFLARICLSVTKNAKKIGLVLNYCNFNE